MATEYSTKVTYTAPPDTASAGFHQPDTLDWSSLSAQIKNRVFVIPGKPPTRVEPGQSAEERTGGHTPSR